jgi:hypothetical protein
MFSYGLSGEKEEEQIGYEIMTKVYLNNLHFDKSTYNPYATPEHIYQKINYKILETVDKFVYHVLTSPKRGRQ